MAIFGFKKRKDEKLEQDAQAAKTAEKAPSKKVKAARGVKGIKADKTSAVVHTPVLTESVLTRSAAVIIRPRITEKSGILSQSGAYTFEVSKNATKNAVASAIKAIYKVTPVKVSVLNTSEKNVIVRGRRGVVSGIRKAVVTLKKGDKIEFV